MDETENPITDADTEAPGTKKHNIRFVEARWLEAVAKMNRIGGKLSPIFHRALEEFLTESDAESALKYETRMAEHYRQSGGQPVEAAQ